MEPLGMLAAGGAVQGILTGINNIWGRHMTDWDREENARLNEEAAQRADVRTRALYNDFYSPEALMKQYKKAGLSPSIMFGGTPGQGGAAGAMSAGSSGLQTPYMPISMLEGAQIANIEAQTQKTKAETQNINKDTYLKELETQIKELSNSQYKQEWNIINSTWTDSETGKQTSLFELAKNCYSYEAFLESVKSSKTDEEIRNAASTEAGQKTLREIYRAASTLNRDIMVLSEETVSASFQLEITRKLQEAEFAKLNAQAAISQLQALDATSELTEKQKNAWNNLLNKLGKKGSTLRDIVIVLGMVLGNYTKNGGIKINTGK